MIYGYIRVSTDKQTVENQRFEILEFAKRNSLVLDSWIEETVSGTIRPENRALGKLLDSIQKDDLIICSELSRLGRSLFMIMSILNKLMEKVHASGQSRTVTGLAMTFSQRCSLLLSGFRLKLSGTLSASGQKRLSKEKKAEGQKLGRPKGSTSDASKLDGAEIGVTIMLIQGISVNQMAKLYGVHRNTVKKFIVAKRLDSVENIERMLKLIG